MRDAIQLERAGIPTVVIVTKPFLPLARSQAHAQGLDELRIVAIGHPLAYVDPIEVQGRAEGALDLVAQALTGSDMSPA